MTQKFSKDDLKKVFTQYLAAQGYKLESLTVDINYSEFSSVTCNITEAKPTKTFIITVGHLTPEEAQKNIQKMIAAYREVITLTEDKGIDYILPQSNIQIENNNNEN